jgi:glutathione S-transferase
MPLRQKLDDRPALGHRLAVDHDPRHASGGRHRQHLGRAPGHPERGRYLSRLHFAETMASLIENLNLSHVFLRPPARPSASVVKITTARLRDTLRALEGMLREDGYLLPSGFSAADAMLGFNLWAAPRFVHLDAFPKLMAYRDRLEARPAFQAARAKDGVSRFYDRDFYELPDG